MPRPVPALLACAVAALAAAGCAAPEPDPPPPPPTTFVLPPPSTVVVPPLSTVVPSPLTEEPPASDSWVMPDLVGSNLQAAQDAIQALTDFEIAFTTSHDATGAGREQLLDRGWRVCDQNIPAGTTITGATVIDFGTVRSDERC